MITYHRNSKKLQKKRTELIYKLLYGDLSVEGKDSIRQELQKINSKIKDYKDITLELRELQRKLIEDNLIDEEREKILARLDKLTEEANHIE